MKASDLKPLEQFALRMVRDGHGIISWYQVARILPVTEFPNEDGNAGRILKQLAAEGLITPTNPQEASSKHKYVITADGKSLLTELGI